MKHAKTKLATTIAFFSLLVSTSAQGANPLGLYVGAGGGRADLKVDASSCRFLKCSNATVAGWTAFAGLQPLPFLGAELQYLNFGHTNQGIKPGVFYLDSPGYSQSDRALAVFATGVVPLPFVDLYAKVGAGLVHTEVSSLFSYPIACATHICAVDETRQATKFGWGLGAQLKLPQLSSLALRAEYVQFSVPSGNPSLLSVALLWKF